MVRSIRQVLLFVCYAASASILAVAARAASFPVRPVQLIVGFDPGGSTDLLARLLAAALTKKWHEAVTVENRPGADAIIATQMVATAPPDGYTLLFSNNNLTIVADERKLPYNPITSFEPICMLVTQPEILMANRTVPANSLEQLITYVKARPGKLNFASAGTGTLSYLGMKMLMDATGMNMVNITFHSSAPSLVSLLGNETQLSLLSVTVAKAFVESGKLKAFGTTTDMRVPAMADVPTIAEAAHLPDFNLGDWDGVLAPAGTPQAVIDEIYTDIAEIRGSPDFQKTVRGRGMLPVDDTRQQFAQFIEKDLQRWKGVIAANDPGQSPSR
jgi:tripartite-type tricarboxylate transporter receptor subunit TctC